MKSIVLLNVAAVVLRSGGALYAQTAGSTVGDFTIERVLTIPSIISPTAPNFPPPVLAGLQAGAIEVHQVFAYLSANGRNRGFRQPSWRSAVWRSPIHPRQVQ